MIGTATPELVFTATTDAAKWVQIYGLLRLTDANEGIYKPLFLVGELVLLVLLLLLLFFISVVIPI